jgi:serine/threonine protein kinase
MAQRLRQGETMVTSLPSTAAYCPPEMARGFAVGTPGDVFQLGIVLYQLLVGRHPFATEAFLEGDDERESELIRYSLANLWCEPSLDAPPLDAPGLRGLLRSMLDRRPQSRPTAAEVAERLGEMR